MTLTHDVIHQLFGADDAELNALLALIDAANQGGQSATRIPANLVINRPNLSALIAIEYDALGPIAGYQRDAVDERQIATLLAKRCSLPADINRAQPAQLAAVQLACT
ncbi:MAG: hypothetical protein HWE20_15255, partial [Gammaproteobacteria bacterium]|nr:hypothetical protein [Gammaproteobacteria bacterium]